MDDAASRPEARFNALFEAHHRAVLAYALRRSVAAEDAEDVAAEAFAIAWRRLADVPAGEEALPWLLGVARRVLANQRRSAQRRLRLGLRLRHRDESVPSPGADLAPALDALARLRPEDQELLRLLAWEGLRHAEVAVVLGVSPNAVAVRLHRARARLERELMLIRGNDEVKGSGPIRTSPGVEGRSPDHGREKTA